MLSKCPVYLLAQRSDAVYLSHSQQVFLQLFLKMSSDEDTTVFQVI